MRKLFAGFELNLLDDDAAGRHGAAAADRAEQAVFIPELQAGFYDAWGTGGVDSCQYPLTNADYERMFTLNAIGQGLHRGWALPGRRRHVLGVARGTQRPHQRRSGRGNHRAGAAHGQGQRLRLLAYAATTIAPLTATNSVAPTAKPTNPLLTALEPINSDTGMRLVVLRRTDLNATTGETARFSISSRFGDCPSVPQGPPLVISPHRAYLLVANLAIGEHTLVYPTS